MTNHHRRPFCFLAVILALAVPHAASGQSTPTVHRTTLGETGQTTPEVSTDEVVRILANGSEPLLDVRSPEEYAIAHIPGSINLYEKEVELVRQRYPDKTTRIVFYCNGPFCGKSKRLSEQLVVLGYTNIRRYQFADTAGAARKVAEEIAGKAYWNSSYFGGTFADLMAAKLW
jgi:rhodanese-related sulfurtransferase